MKPADYRLSAVINAICAESWGRLQSDERREHERLSKLAGCEPASAGTARIPGHALRDLSVATRANDLSIAASGGGYLAGNTTTGGEYIASLTGDSAALRLGVRVLTVPAQTAVFALPVGTAGPTVEWLPSETTQVNDSTPTLASYAATPKLASAYCEISRRLLLQAPNAEDVLREEMRKAAAAALDAVIFAGSGGSGQPQGIVGSAGVGAFTGTSLDQAALRNAQADLGTAKAITDPAKVAYATTPAIAETLTKRQRFTGSDRALWEGSSFDGTVEGVRAISTAAMPAATMICADWSSLWVAEFAGGLTIDVDPFTKFATGIVGVRLLLPVDVLMARPAAFTVATSIT